LRLEDVDYPKLEPDGAIMRVKATLICGGDLVWYERGGLGGPGSSRSIEGHEWSGEVVEVGANVTNLRPGDRVPTAGYGAFAEYVGIPDTYRVQKLPEHISYEVGAFTEPLSIGTSLAMRAEPSLGDTVVVFGAGAIGLGAAQVFRIMGASKVIVVEIAKKRLEVAKATGADVVINATEEDPVEKVNDITSGTGADIVAICTTAPDAFRRAFDAARGGDLYQTQVNKAAATRGYRAGLEIRMLNRKAIDPLGLGGKVVMVAGGQPPDYQLPVVQKMLTVRGSWGGDMTMSLELLSSGKIDVEPWITHEFPLDRIDEAFETQLRRDEAVKVVIKP